MENDVSVPSTGQWIEKRSLAISGRASLYKFQYPLRANGLRSLIDSGYIPADSIEFQYPLRANGLRSAARGRKRVRAGPVSVPSTGQWIEKHELAQQRGSQELFQYPLRANGLRSFKM